MLNHIARLTAIPICLVLLSISGASRSVAAELLMLTQDGCSWCERWNSEIGPIYPKTEEAVIAPLRVVDIDDPWPLDIEYVAMDVFTPTFVLVDNGIEVARLRGYAGEEFFWFLLGEMLEKLSVQNEL